MLAGTFKRKSGDESGDRRPTEEGAAVEAAGAAVGGGLALALADGAGEALRRLTATGIGLTMGDAAGAAAVFGGGETLDSSAAATVVGRSCTIV